MGEDKSDPFRDADPLEAILSAAVAAIVTIDRDGIIGYANPAVRTVFGHEPADIVGRNVSILMAGNDAELHNVHIDRHVRTRRAHILGIGRNVRALHADGTTFPVHISVGEMATGGASGYVAIITDQSALEVTRTRLTEAIGGLEVGLALFDRAGRLVLCNERHRAIHRLPDHLCRPGTTFAAHVEPIGVADGPLAPSALETGSARSDVSDHRYDRPDGRTLSVGLRTLNNGDAILTTQDTTGVISRDALVQRAARLRALGELTGGVAHDFNNLLAVIIGNLELLEGRVSETEAHAMLREALEAAEIGARVTDRLLAFARRQPLAAEAVHVNDLVLDIVSIVKRTLGEGIDMSFDLAPSLPTVIVDRGQLESGLVNLATNARDAMPDGGRLVIETGTAHLDGDDEMDLPTGTFVRLSVTDTGVGMAPEVRVRAFEPFFTTKGKGRGSGLGLSSLYGFAQQSGGALTVYSEVGKGSTFNLYLPIAGQAEPAGEAQPPAHPAERPMLEGKVVLVVEDDDRVRRTSVRRVKNLGATVIEAVSAADAIEKAAELERVDILFTDIMMPGGMDGYELARHMKAAGPDVSILLTSGYAEDKANAEAFAQSGLALLRKPYRQIDLQHAFETLLR